jgi:glycosyltransferase involved in cell wall biosynthesis
MKHLRILIGITYWLPNISGVTQYGVILADTLAKRNYKVKVISAKFKNNLKDETNLIRVWGFQIGKGFIMPTYWWTSFWEVKRADIINCHLPSIESFWLALWGKLFGKKVFITHHCEFNFTGSLSNKVISLITFPIHWWTYFLADKIIAYTKDYADNSVFLRLFKNKLVYILPPIKIEKIKTLYSKLKYREKIVGFVGRIAWEKGLDILIKAMEGVEAKLMLVGPYDNVAGDDTYKKLKNVNFSGPVEHKKLNQYYEMFDCLVLPSTNNLETFGIVQAEAMVCGTPVVASNLPGVRVPVTLTGMGEICEVGDSQSLQNKINIVLNNGKKYYQDKAKNLDNFDFQKTVDRYEEMF